jgi:plasmid maintenance system antidote protein VapI
MQQDTKEFIKALMGLVEQKGSRRAAALSLKITPQYLNDMLHGRRGVSVNMARKLGFVWKLEKTS